MATPGFPQNYTQLWGHTRAGDVLDDDTTYPVGVTADSPLEEILQASLEGGGGGQTGAQIKTAYEAEADTNAFTDADVTKLAGYDYLKTTGGAVNAALTSGLTIGDVITTAAYYQGSDLGGCTYRVVAAATGTNDGGSYIDAGSLQLQAVFGDSISPAHFGCVLDGVADDGSGFRNCVTYSAGIAPIKFTPEMILYTTQDIDIVSDTSIEGNGATIIAEDGILRVFQIQGTVAGSGIALTSDADLGEHILSLASTPGFSVGDWIGITSDGDASEDVDGFTRPGEMAKVAAISGTTVHIDADLGWDYTTAESAQVFEISNPIRNVSISGFKFQLANPTTYQARAVEARWTEGLRLTNLHVEAGMGGGIDLRNCVEFLVDDFRCDHLPSATSPYNYASQVRGMSARGTISNISTSRVRHAFTTSSDFGSFGGANLGYPRDIVVRDGIAVGTDQDPTTHIAPWHTHGEGYRITFENLRAIGPGAHGHSFERRDREFTTRNCESSGTNHGGFFFSYGASGTVIDSKSTGGGDAGFEFDPTFYGNVTIERCHSSTNPEAVMLPSGAIGQVQLIDCDFPIDAVQTVAVSDLSAGGVTITKNNADPYYESNIRGVVENLATTGIVLPGATGNYVSTPDHADLDITGDIDIRVWAIPDDYTPTDSPRLLEKGTASPDRSYLFRLENAGHLRMFWSTAGTAWDRSETSSVIVGTDAIGFRVTLDVSTGDTDFYTTTDGTTWDALGVTQTSGATSIFAGSGTLALSATSTTQHWAGSIQKAEVYDGIAGTLVANPVFDKNVGVFTDSQGKEWTVLGDIVYEIDVVATLDDATLTDAGTPAATDQVLIKDAGTGALQTADFSDFTSAFTTETGVAVTAEGIHAALVNLGLITA